MSSNFLILTMPRYSIFWNLGLAMVNFSGVNLRGLQTTGGPGIVSM